MGVTVREKTKGSGVWWMFINHNGKRKAKKVGDKKLAQEVSKKIEAKLVLGEMQLEDEQIKTFGEYADEWINLVVPTNCKASTVADYQSLLNNYVLKKFKTLAVNEISRAEIKNYLRQKYQDGLSMSTVKHLRAVLAGVFNLAVDDETLLMNPAHQLGKIFTQREETKKIDPLNRHELKHLLEVFKKHYAKHYPLILLLARTGMRIGEALALQWSDIDFNSQFIIVNKTFSRGVVVSTKSGKERRIDMSRQLHDELIKLLHERKIETLKKGWPEIPKQVFVSSTGNYLDMNNFRNRVFFKALDKAKLRRIRVHDIRRIRLHH